MDATIYAIVLHPALHDLLHAGPGGAPVSDGDIGKYGGIIFSIFLIGWAVGGVLFGVAADYFGRTKTLIATILIYAVFTGLAALSETWWHLALYRFLTALGVGGEWAAGASIVAEVWPEEKRAKAAGILQSAWAAGFFLAAAFNLLLSGYGWRILFVVGVGPALVALMVRLWVREPERWVKVHAQEIRSGSLRGVKLPELFRGDLERGTLNGLLNYLGLTSLAQKVPLEAWYNISTSQFISLCMFALGATILYRRGRQMLFSPTPATASA